MYPPGPSFFSVTPVTSGRIVGRVSAGMSISFPIPVATRARLVAQFDSAVFGLRLGRSRKPIPDLRPAGMDPRQDGTTVTFRVIGDIGCDKDVFARRG